MDPPALSERWFCSGGGGGGSTPPHLVGRTPPSPRAEGVVQGPPGTKKMSSLALRDGALMFLPLPLSIWWGKNCLKMRFQGPLKAPDFFSALCFFLPMGVTPPLLPGGGEGGMGPPARSGSRSSTRSSGRSTPRPRRGRSATGTSTAPAATSRRSTGSSGRTGWG